uniref:Uncharacterized protein n=1 Tax=Kalanchoe fedtschenkoi TaxID=63787 RepID=A0A7N0V6J9_KALFE
MSNQKKRNFQIEAFKHRVVVDPKYSEKTWKILEHAIHEIYNHNASGLSFEELYRLVTFIENDIFSHVTDEISSLDIIRDIFTSNIRSLGLTSQWNRRS